MKSYYVYILLCSDKSYYTGITSNLEQRLESHKAGYYRDSYTCSRRPVKLVYFETFNDVLQAIWFEKKIKGWTHTEKKALIEGDFDRLKLLSECRNATHWKFKPEQ